jgi:Flp pilus assembly protein TadB
LVGVVGSWWQSLDLTWSSSIAQTWTLLSTVEHYKKVLIDDFVSNKSIIDQWACDFTLSQIQKISTNSTVQISAVILLTLLILVFLNTLFIIVGIIIFLILLALYSMWFYRSKYISETVEKLEW